MSNTSRSIGDQDHHGARPSHERAVNNRRHRSSWAVWFVSLLCAELIILPLPSAFAQSAGGSDPQLTPTSPAFAEAEPGVAPTAAPAPATRPTATVSPTGALGYSFALELPPGRNGAAPSLALAYSSDALQEVSPFGAGWSLPLSSIRRNTRFGTPPVAKSGTAYKYDDGVSDYVPPRFERDGTELAVELKPCTVRFCVPSRVPDSRGVVYRDRIELGPTKSIYNAAGDYWLVIDAAGNQRYYGHVPDGSIAAAVVTDDLGTTQWGLLRSVDPFGNAVDYTYVVGPSRASAADPQLRLLPDTIQYGKNLTTGAAHFATVKLAYQVQLHRIGLDHLHGHTYLDRVIDTITVSLTSPSGTITVRKYTFSLVQAPGSAHFLLHAIQETAGTITGPSITFSYTTNTYSPVQPWLSTNATLAAALPSPAFRNFVTGFPVSTGAIDYSVFAATPPWPNDWFKRLSLSQLLLSPPGLPTAFRFDDLDGDGKMDILYHPNYAAGFGIAEPWVSFRNNGANAWNSFDATYGSADPLSTALGASQYVDVDRDGVVDRIKLNPNIKQDGSPSSSNPAVAGLCAWWFEHQGGYTDPPPDNVAIEGVYLIDIIGRMAGFAHDGAWGGAIGQIFQSALNGTLPHMTGPFRAPVVPLDGGIPGAVAACYRPGSSGGPPINVNGDWLPIPLPGGPNAYETNLGGVTIEHGRMIDPIVTSPLRSVLAKYPPIGEPGFYLQFHPAKDPQGNPISVPQSVHVTNNVFEPLVDLDGDGVPEIVALKASQNGYSTFGAGVWRLRNLAAVHELDDGYYTNTRFVQSLHTLLTRPVPLFYPSTNPPSCASGGMQFAMQPARPPGTLTLNQQVLAYFQTEANRYSAQVTISPEESLAVRNAANQMLTTGPINNWINIAINVEIPRLISDADWIGTFMDLNGDSLPDLVLARGATCIDTTHVPATTDQRLGFDVYLNRGDRFETTPDSGALTGGPFAMVRNWSSTVLADNVLLDGGFFPFAALAFTDLNGDGVKDATLSALINVAGNSPISWPFDTNACTEDYTIGPGQPGPQYVIHCVWRGGNSGWTADKTLAGMLPHDDFNAALGWNGRFTVNPQVFDMTRYVDVDGDGMTDLVGVRGGPTTQPNGDATRVYRNANRMPDLLASIDNGIGRVTSVAYAPFVPGQNVYQAPTGNGRIPTARWVVSNLTESTMSGSGDQEWFANSLYSYQDGKYDFANREFLGFRKVTEQRLASFGRKEISWLQIDREYFQDEQPQSLAPNPLKGLLSAVSSRGAGVETQRTSYTYEVLSHLTYVGVRRTSSTDLTCAGGSCDTQSGAPAITITHQLSSFDDYDNAQVEAVTGTRQLGDGLDQSLSYTVNRTYQNDTDHWILGLKATEVRSDSAGLISSDGFTYLLDKLATHTTKRYGIAAGCNDSGVDFQVRTEYTAEGLPRDFYDNNQQIVGGSAPHRHVDYDSFYRAYPTTTTDYYTSNGSAATLTHVDDYDVRFGALRLATDANGRTRETDHDGLGRVTDEYNEDGVLVRHTDYDLTTRPISATTTEYPGAGQPNIVTVAYFDGAGRLRQQSAVTATGAVLQQWRTFDSLGELAASAIPAETSSTAFIPYSSTASTSLHASLTYHDARGRAVDHVLADGRETTTQYALGKTTSVDARKTPSDVYSDAFGRVIAVDEYYLSSLDTSGTFAKLRTSFVRDTAGNVLQSTSPDGHVRRFTYNHAGQVVTAEAPHAANAAPTQIDRYTMCYDGNGTETRATTPEGRSVTHYHDELGRITVRTASPSGDTTTYAYDDATVPNGLGRVSKIANAHATAKTLAYDTRGNPLQRVLSTSLGAAASPWGDGVYTTTASYDALNRPLTQVLPFDGQLMSTALQAQLTYNERGLPKTLTLGGVRWLGIDDYAPDSRARGISYGNGLSEQRVYDPTSAHLTSSTLKTAAGVALESYSFGYDANDNFNEVDRSFPDPTSGTGRIRTKGYAFDSLNRVESERSWIGPPTRPFTRYFRYSPGGNITQKDALDYAYQGRDPQAVSARLSSGTAVEQYGYDRDGWMTSATPDSSGSNWQYGYDSEGHMVSASSNGEGSPSLAFVYAPDGKRLAKQQSCAVGACASWSDLYIDELELRGSEAAQAGLPAFYNLRLGPVRAQLALRRSTAGKLERDAQADRYYFADYLGSTALVTAQDGQPIDAHGENGRFDYDAYGRSMPMTGTATNIKERYNGKELDETGLSYYGARYASTALGRWTGRDPAYLLQPGTFGQRANLYSFDDNNPVSRVDGDGHEPKATIESHYYLEQGWFRQHYEYHANIVADSRNSGWQRVESAIEAAATLLPAALEEVGRGILLVPHDADMAAQLAARSTLEHNTFAKIDDISGSVAHAAAAFDNAGVVGSAVGANLPVTAATGELEAMHARVAEVHGVLDPIAQGKRTTSLLRTDAGDIVAGGAKRDLTPAQRAALKQGETSAKAPGVHAELTALGKAKAMGAKPESLVVTRPICANCASGIEDSGGRLINSKTAVWPK
jgi:RHS repeat-associated protein